MSPEMLVLHREQVRAETVLAQHNEAHAAMKRKHAEEDHAAQV